MIETVLIQEKKVFRIQDGDSTELAQIVFEKTITDENGKHIKEAKWETGTLSLFVSILKNTVSAEILRILENLNKGKEVVSNV